MAAIEFTRIHIVRMGNEDFDKFFCRQFPSVTRYVMINDDITDNDETKETIT